MYDFNAVRPQLEALCKRFSVSRLTAFGSSIRDDFTNSSDIDLIVAARTLDLSGYSNLKDELEKLFGRKVDLLTQERLEEMTNRFRKRGILSKTRVLYG